MIISSERCNEPTGASPQPKVIVTLIHGTFAQEAVWVLSGSLLRSRLESAFGNRIAFPSSPFKWSGDNNVYARWDAGKELLEHIKILRATYPDRATYS